jgi:hypothetical protein
MLISPTASGNVVQILYSILTCDIDVNTRVGTVSWRMSIRRFESMKQDGWVLYFWQTDEPCPPLLDERYSKVFMDPS